MNNQGGLSGAHIWSSRNVGGHINFRFMRRPIGWLKKLEDDVYKIRSPEIENNQQWTRSPLEFNSRCWLHAEMAPNGDPEEYERELKRWYPVLSQSYVVDEERERTLFYEHKETGEQVKVVDYHRWTVYSDGSYDEYNILDALDDRRKPQDQNKPTADRPEFTADMPADGQPLTEGVEFTIDSAWQDDLDAIWAGERGIPCLIKREEDRPGLKYSEFLTLNETPFSKSTFLKGTDTSQYRVIHGTGVDNFTNWVWLYRRARANGETSTNPSSEYHGPCIVLLAKIKWRVEHNHHYKYDEDGKLFGVDPAGSKTTLLDDNSNPVDAEWMYFTPLSSPEVHHTRPTKAESNGRPLEFPDIRFDSDISRWTQWDVYHAKKNADGVLGEFEPKSRYDRWFRTILEGSEDIMKNRMEREINPELHLLLNEARAEFGGVKFRPKEAPGMFKPLSKGDSFTRGTTRGGRGGNSGVFLGARGNRGGSST
ncbi:hypothetical protein N657DRAFT_675632 [Parathielavia appendiculata]|uniref:Uncharacterized protein n=1 Tax=Parathielavia appendiculata TaxID=2587402 RepID=A0AAN6YZD6_9PEZI|nr:hypothetical protein N657DRAFT_675632 [Parathielavia appendiculata]